MKKIYAASLALVTFGLASNVYAHDVAVGAKLSTLGYGVDFTTSLTKKLNLRAGTQWSDFTFVTDIDDEEYDSNLKLFSGLMVADWYPFEGTFKITGGILIKDNKFYMSSKDRHSRYSNLAMDYGPSIDDIIEVETETSYNKVSPYLGIGWGNPVSKDSNWNFVFDVGVVMLMDSPDVTFQAADSLASNNIEDDLGISGYFPVVSLGLNYKF